MNNTPEIKDIDTALLTEFVQQSLNHRDAEIKHWTYRPVSYINTETSNLGLYCFQGSARVEGEDLPWSIVLKAVHAPINEAEQSSWNYHRREIFAYQQGLLSNLPGGLQVPRCFGVTEHPGGVCWLWLEDVQDSVGPTWSLVEYGLAARHLGRFNGAYAAGYPIPTASWLSQNWLRGWVNRYEAGCRETLDVMRAANFWEQPVLRSAFPTSITADTLQLWEQHDQLFAVLNQLPRTFCHMDAYRPNLFLRRNSQGEHETVAIDWVFAGPSGIGEELANLFAASLIWFEYDAADAQGLDETIFINYVRGMREADWHGDAQLVRLGYTAACALRWGVVGLWWLRSLKNEVEKTELEKQWNRSIPELARQFAKTTYYILGMAEEAYQLQRKLF
jgi:Phosphotransferase enzyme family